MRCSMLCLATIAIVLGATPASADGLLCGRGWHYSWTYFKCVQNRHRCAAGTHWVSLLKVCV